MAYLMPDESTRQREFKPLAELRGDHFPRLVLTLDEVDFSENGIIHRPLIEWCLNESGCYHLKEMR